MDDLTCRCPAPLATLACDTGTETPATVRDDFIFIYERSVKYWGLLNNAYFAEEKSEDHVSKVKDFFATKLQDGSISKVCKVSQTVAF